MRERRTNQPCGTVGAYRRHKRRGQEPCEPCYSAIRAKAQRDYRIKGSHGGILVPEGQLCEVCGSGDKITVHHDHGCCPTKGRSCGKCFLAFLCQQCNAGLGMFGDDAERMRRAADVHEAAVARLKDRDA